MKGLIDLSSILVFSLYWNSGKGWLTLQLHLDIVTKFSTQRDRNQNDSILG